MGTPRFEPGELPFIADEQATRYALELPGRTLTIGAVSMGNPHAVLQVNDIVAAPVAEFGPLLERHPRFPIRVNVGFLEVVYRGHVRLRVFERGAGETLAYGTGACAVVAVGRRGGLLDQEVAVDLPGGRLSITWAGDDAPVWMTGPAERVFEGRIELCAHANKTCRKTPCRNISSRNTSATTPRSSTRTRRCSPRSACRIRRTARCR